MEDSPFAEYHPGTAQQFRDLDALSDKDFGRLFHETYAFDIMMAVRRRRLRLEPVPASVLIAQSWSESEKSAPAA
jgi:hypothetical protein